MNEDKKSSQDIFNKCSLDILVAMIDLLNSNRISDTEFRKQVTATANNIKKMEVEENITKKKYGKGDNEDS